MLGNGRKNDLPMIVFYIVGTVLITGMAVLFSGKMAAFGSAWDNLSGQYVTTCMKDMGWFEKPIWLETEVASCMSTVVEETASEEFLKAFAVVIRSEILARGITAYEIHAEDSILQKSPVWEICEDAARKTKGIYLAYNHQVIAPLWTQVTNGKTRDGEENHMKGKPYIRKAMCKEDVMSPFFTSTMECKRNLFLKAFETELCGEDRENWTMGWPDMVCERDSSDYVMKMYLGEEKVPVDGGEFARRLGLVSPCFTWKYLDDTIVFQVKGLGHGFGMSLNQAGKLSEEGKTFREILTYFYPQTELDKCY